MDAGNASIAPHKGRQTNRLTIRDIASMPLRIPPINQVGQHDNTRSMSGTLDKHVNRKSILVDNYVKKNSICLII